MHLCETEFDDGKRHCLAEQLPFKTELNVAMPTRTLQYRYTSSEGMCKQKFQKTRQAWPMLSAVLDSSIWHPLWRQNAKKGISWEFHGISCHSWKTWNCLRLEKIWQNPKKNDFPGRLSGSVLKGSPRLKCPKCPWSSCCLPESKSFFFLILAGMICSEKQKSKEIREIAAINLKSLKPRLEVEDSSAERSSFSKSTKLRVSPKITEVQHETQLNAMDGLIWIDWLLSKSYHDCHGEIKAFPILPMHVKCNQHKVFILICLPKLLVTGASLSFAKAAAILELTEKASKLPKEKARKEKSFSIQVFQPMKTSQAWSFIDVFLFEPRHTTPWTCLLRRKWTRKWWSRFLEVIFWQMRNDWESTSKLLWMHNFGILFRLGLATGRWLRQYAFKLVTHPDRRVDFKSFSGGRMVQVSSHIISYR